MLEIDKQGWLTEITHCKSDNYNSRPAQTAISLLVIHNISLPAGQFNTGCISQLFTNALDCTVHPSFADLVGLKVSAHCLIDRLGQVTQYVSFDDRAWHAGVSVFEGMANCNDYAIGIELEGTDDLPYSQAQYQSLSELTQLLLRRYPITRDRIVGHCDIAPGRKTDPGSAFDWSAYFAMLTDR